MSGSSSGNPKKSSSCSCYQNARRHQKQHNFSKMSYPAARSCFTDVRPLTIFSLYSTVTCYRLQFCNDGGKESTRAATKISNILTYIPQSTGTTRISNTWDFEDCNEKNVENPNIRLGDYVEGCESKNHWINPKEAIKQKFLQSYVTAKSCKATVMKSVHTTNDELVRQHCCYAKSLQIFQGCNHCLHVLVLNLPGMSFWFGERCVISRSIRSRTCTTRKGLFFRGREKYVNIPSEKYIYVHIYVCICVYTYLCKMDERRSYAGLS